MLDNSKEKEEYFLRIKEALREFDFFSEEEIDKITSHKGFRFFGKTAKPPQSKSSFYQFSNKVGTIIHFFSNDGLTRSDYLNAAAKNPSLFYQSPDAIIGNILGVVDHFAHDGLTLSDYLKAAIKHPSLFHQSQQTLINNITTVVDHFEKDGLSRSAYLKAAIKKPSLFYQSPQTLITNITSVVDHFRKDGMILTDYLRTAMKQPQLFQQSPQTINGHIYLYKRLYESGKITIYDEVYNSELANPFKRFFEFLLKHPLLLSLSDNNIQLRNFTSAMLEDYQLNSKSVLTKKKDLMADMMDHLRYEDPHKPVKKIYDLKELVNDEIPFSKREKLAKNLLLRGMIRAGLLPGKLEDETTDHLYTDKVKPKSIKAGSDDLKSKNVRDR